MVEFGKVYEGDFLDVLEGELGYSWADVVCTGPSSYDHGDKRFRRETDWAIAFKKVLSPDGVLFLVCPWGDVFKFVRALCEAQFSTQRLHQVTGASCFNAGGVIVATAEAADAPFLDAHFKEFTPTPWSSSFPVEVPERAIETYCPEDGIVFDPFFGMGTTAVSAIRLGRKWVGCEKEGSRIQEAYRRIEKETGWSLTEGTKGKSTT